ncbi:ferric reductase transmembrane component 7 [Gaeumannomyces tritici R3-111a-1]|uniref:ferric-chelate reductase (NADPH) n=1 Tax=Gaeumannomyces tritici (strain R3-111a-1) TaxID=644352 RepID=J3PDZ9_GAET3|nr:ferric reductase transmembrane component 7 [Gaeumannomyces tritici R3-111a-1]EJT70699.1 ferric reductase transmembrane component 7 [Gaeumannomyces tritici R3-111a-1]
MAALVQQPRAAGLVESSVAALSQLAKRIYIPLTPLSPPGQIEANTVDPWTESGKYGLGWTYFALALTACVLFTRVWHFWQDKIRQAIYKQEVEQHWNQTYAIEQELQQQQQQQEEALHTGRTSGRHFFPEEGGKEEMAFRPKAHMSSVGFVNDTLALFRWIFYRPIPDIRWHKHRFTFSSLAVLAVVTVATIFATIYCFILQPLYWQSIKFGSPPLAVRAGMIAVALTPWIIATSTKANLLTMITGIGPERLNVFHRWGGYLCLFLSLVHTIPFYVQPVWDDGGLDVFSKLFPEGSGAIYGTGIACLVPLVWLCIASLPFIRRIAYEIFVMLHVPVGLIYIAVLFWHTKNFLNSWSYLYASLAIFFVCAILRVFNLNWTKPWRMAFMVGDEAAITLLSENAVKITIPTQMRWKPGQFVYLRMPGISLFENHPFTISSLCSEDFPSEYGENYRDCVLVFRPYGGFTRKVLETAIEKGPFHTYRAFLDGPYGGMRRDLAAFDTVILIAGGSGVTALMSQLLNLIKRMRDGKAITKKIVVVWALKRLEAMDWFREELRICREAAPPESVTCKFFVTAAVRQQHQFLPQGFQPQRAPRPLSNMFHDKLDGFVAGIASKRNSAFIHSEARGDPDRERELRAEDEDRITALPQQKYLQPHNISSQGQQHPPPPPLANKDRASVAEDTLRQLEGRDMSMEQASEAPSDRKGSMDKKGEFHFPAMQPRLDVPTFQYAPPGSPGHNRLSQHLVPPSTSDGNATPDLQREQQQQPYDDPDKKQESKPASTDAPRPPELAHLRTDLPSNTLRPAPQLQRGTRPTSTFGPPSGFEFGFPETPTEFQKSLMRFAFPIPHQIDGGWSVEYGRPDLGYMLKEWATGGADGRGILGRRTAVFVCGPAAMRVGVANTVARLQAEIWGDEMLEEIYLHTENYAL